MPDPVFQSITLIWLCASLTLLLCHSRGGAVLLDLDGRLVPPLEAAAGLPRVRGHPPHEALPNRVQVSEAHIQLH